MAARAMYGANPHAGVDPNLDRGWGGFAWPQGVPAKLLGAAVTPWKQKIIVRVELVELVTLAYRLADVKHHRRFERGWTGGYENRPIAGTAIASNHSRGRAIDNDAQTNPMSYTWQCDIPPALVADWESLGFFWGGRYTGQTDPMHFEYCYPPGDVAGHVAKAEALLAPYLPGGAGGYKPPAPPGTPTTITTTAPATDWLDPMIDEALLRKIITEEVTKTLENEGVSGARNSGNVVRLIRAGGSDTIWVVNTGNHTKWGVPGPDQYNWLKAVGIQSVDGDQAPFTIDDYEDISHRPLNEVLQIMPIGPNAGASVAEILNETLAVVTRMSQKMGV